MTRQEVYGSQETNELFCIMELTFNVDVSEVSLDHAPHLGGR